MSRLADWGANRACEAASAADAGRCTSAEGCCGLAERAPSRPLSAGSDRPGAEIASVAWCRFCGKPGQNKAPIIANSVNPPIAQGREWEVLLLLSLLLPFFRILAEGICTIE